MNLLKYTFLIIFILLASGCRQKYHTNEECIQLVCKSVGCENFSRTDRALAEMGASAECAKNGNDPQEALRNL